jgi:hypothetical protein
MHDVRQGLNFIFPQFIPKYSRVSIIVSSRYLINVFFFFERVNPDQDKTSGVKKKKYNKLDTFSGT